MQAVRPPSVSLATRVLIALWAFACVALFAMSLSLVNRPFPGFWVSADAHIGATDLADWPGSRAGLKPLDGIVTMGGRPLTSGAALVARVCEAPVGTPFRYGLADGRVLTVRSIAFGAWDAMRSLWTWWIAAVVHLGLGAWVLYRRPEDVAAQAHWRYCQAFGLFLLGGLAGMLWPWATVFNYVGTALMLPALIELAIVLPVRVLEPATETRVVRGVRLGAGVLLAGVALAFVDPRWWVPMFNLTLLVSTLALLVALAIWIAQGVSSRVTVRERAQARVILGGMGLSLLPSAFFTLFGLLGHPLPGFELAFLGFCAMPAAIAYAIVRHQAFELERLLHRATHYSLLLAGLGALYVAAATAAHQALGRLTPDPSGVSVAGFLAAVTVASAFRPLHDGLRGLVDRVFLGVRANPLKAAADFGARTAAAEAPMLAFDMAGLVKESLGAEWVSLRLGTAAPIASGEPPPGASPTLEAEVPGDPAGHLWVGPRADGMRYDRHDQALLDVLASLTALGVARTALFDERLRLEVRHAEAVARAEARDSLFQQVVHDIGTDLSNIAVAAELARQMPGEEGPLGSIEASLTRIERFLSEKRAHLREAPGPRRTTLASGFALAAASLAPGLAAKAQRLDTAGPPVAAVPLTDVELAQVLINVIGNASKFSPAGSPIQLDWERVGDEVCLRVIDGGTGFAESPGHGLGLLNTRSLVQGAGGKLLWRNGAPGAIVEVVLPVLA